MSRVLGVDFGTKRVGLAISDELNILASPLAVVTRGHLQDVLREIAAEHELAKVVIGLPTGLAGHEGDSATGARRLGEEIGKILQVDVVFVDERFTSRIADDALLKSGMKRRERKDTVDKVAAAIILQTYLDTPRSAGNSPENPGVEPPGLR